jgi:TolA-binding protein
MNKLGHKTAVLLLILKGAKTFFLVLKKAPACLCTGAFLFALSSCVMTRAQGEKISMRVDSMESEVAKLQRVRHDLEVLVSGKVSDLLERVRQLEEKMASLRENLYEGSNRNSELVNELQKLRGQVEEAEFRYKGLERDQQDLVKNQEQLQEIAEKMRIPPLKDDHFSLAKKLHISGKNNDALMLFEEFVKLYPNDKEQLGQSYYNIAEILREFAKNEKDEMSAENYRKKAILSYQKIVDMYKKATLKEEALYKMGLVLRELNNDKAAKAAFKALIQLNAKSKRINDAKKELAQIE